LFESSKPPLVLKRQKENTMNIYSDDYIFMEEVRNGIHHLMSEEAKKRVHEILYKFFTSRNDPLSILRKYFTIWHRKTNYISLLDNAQIISEFCKRKLKNYFTLKKWKKIGEKLVIREKIRLIKSSRALFERINKIFNLIRITRVNSLYSKNRYLHYIIIAWLVYTRNIVQKRTHVKSLYENMLNTYMNMADDIFGNNQIENPSVQDALFEAVDSDKFQTKDLQDVPLAKEYYGNKKDITKISKNITYYYGNDEKIDAESDDKEYIMYKTYINKNPISTSVNFNIIGTNSSGKEKVIKDEEKLQFKGRGRAFRTNEEKEIFNKFFIENNMISNDEKNNDEEYIEEEEIEEKKYYKNYNIIDKKDKKDMSFKEKRIYYAKNKNKNKIKNDDEE
jgi:hypothetical protein